MKKILLTVLQYVIFFGLGALLIWWQYGKLTPDDKTEILTSFSQVSHRLWLLVPVLIIGFLSHLFRALRWKLLLEPLKLRPSTANITFAVLIGYLVNLLVPRMGEVARCSILAKYENEPVDKIVGTIVAERAFDLLCLVLVTIIAVFTQTGTGLVYLKEQFSQFNVTGGNIAMLVGGAVLFVAVLIVIYRLTKNTKFGHFLKGIGYGILSIKFMHKKGQFLMYTALIWICYLSLVVVGFMAIDATEHLGWVPAIAVLVFGSLGMILTPGGIGAYPPAVQLVLVNLYSIKASYALAFGWVSWMAQTAIVLVLGILSLILLPLYNVKRHGQKTVDTE